MAELKAFSPNVELSGGVALAYINGFGNPDLAIRLLEEIGVKDIQPDSWIKLQSFFDAMIEIKKQLGDITFYRMGENIPATAKFPPMRDIFDGFEILDQAYHINHRGGEIGYYKVINKGFKHITVECFNPYPCRFDTGLLQAFAKKFKPDALLEENESVKGCRQKNSDYCTYKISW